MRTDQIPIDEDSFLKVHNPDLIQRVAADMHAGWHANAMLAKLRDQHIAEAAANPSSGAAVTTPAPVTTV